MKLKITAVMVSVICVFLLCSCGGTADSTVTPSDIMKKITLVITEKEMIDGIVYVGAGTYINESFDNETSETVYDLDGYCLDDENVMSYDIFLPAEGNNVQLGIYKLKSGGDVNRFKGLVSDMLKSAGTENAVVSSHDNYVYYLATEINDILEKVIIEEIESNYVDKA